jgi:hypothetical protein
MYGNVDQKQKVKESFKNIKIIIVVRLRLR